MKKLKKKAMRVMMKKLKMGCCGRNNGSMRQYIRSKVPILRWTPVFTIAFFLPLTSLVVNINIDVFVADLACFFKKGAHSKATCKFNFLRYVLSHYPICFLLIISFPLGHTIKVKCELHDCWLLLQSWSSN